MARVGEDLVHRVSRRQPLGLRDAMRRVHVLCGGLVHAQRRPEHAGTDVRDACELEEALDGAVLTHWTVHEREHHDLGRVPVGWHDGRERIELGGVAVVR